MRWDDYISLLLVRVSLLLQVIVWFLAAIVENLEAIAFVNIKIIIGLVFDFNEIHTIFLVVINRIGYPFLDDVHLDVFIRHCGIGAYAKYGGIAPF